MISKKVILAGLSLALTGSLPLTTVLADNPQSASTPQQQVKNGWIQLPAPPSDFNPLTATNSQLLKYGLPVRPSNPMELARWETTMKHAKHYVAPDPVFTNDTYGLVGTNPSNWAGYEVDANNNNNVTYNTTQSYITVPTFYGTVGGSSAPGFWTGIGGGLDGKNNVDQAGLCINSTSSNFTTKGVRQYELWYEDYPGPVIWISNPVIHAGDVVDVEVQYGPYSGETTVYYEDMTTGNYTSYVESTPYFWGSTAEYVAEQLGSTSSWTEAVFNDNYLLWDTTSGSSGGGNFTSYNYWKDTASPMITSSVNTSTTEFTVQS